MGEQGPREVFPLLRHPRPNANRGRCQCGSLCAASANFNQRCELLTHRVIGRRSCAARQGDAVGEAVNRSTVA